MFVSVCMFMFLCLFYLFFTVVDFCHLVKVLNIQETGNMTFL